MVHSMKNRKSEPRPENAPGVKMEVEDSLEDEHGPHLKRHKNLGGIYALPASEYNPLDEPSPLGLRLRKSPSLLELIQMKLSQPSTEKVGGHGKKETKASGAFGDKLKASNFPASILKIGSWEYKSRYEGDLVAKCYFAKHKLVWEVLDGGLKNKIEIQWSDIMSLKAKYPDDGIGTLDVVLARQPLFFRETNPQPRKHTLWQATSDFTDGQASIHRRHYLECPQGLLGKHFEKLIQCDPRLHFLSQQGEITLDSPYFDPRISVFDDQNVLNKEFDLNREGSPSFFSLHDASTSGQQSSSSKNDHEAVGRRSESYPRETPSPTSVRDIHTLEAMRSGEIEQLKALSNWDQIKVPGLRSSMSMSDLLNHLEHRVAEHGESSNANLSNEEWHGLQVLDDINRYLFSDSQHVAEDSDEKSLMSRVNSLCCLLQKDTPPGPNVVQRKADESNIVHDESDDMSGGQEQEQAGCMSRKDSVGDLLLNLPRIASLPQFLYNISEDYENQAR